jgi:L-lactate dehydrogenase complex protein LldG
MNNNAQHNNPPLGARGSRESILAAIKNNKPTLVDLPTVDINAVIQYSDLVAQFKTALESIGGIAIEINSLEDLKTEINQEKQAGNYIANTIPALGSVDATLETLTANELEAVHKSYLQATIGIAENGSVWLYEHQMVNRLLPFICQHLVIVLEKKNIVATMHHAYQHIEAEKEGFGLFLAGPSKTADIEQSLVIGAHGARSLVVYLV